MFDRAREDADRLIRGDDAAVRSVSGAAPCGRKESGDDGRGVGRRRRCDRGGGRGSFAVAESTDQAEDQGQLGHQQGIVTKHRCRRMCL